MSGVSPFGNENPPKTAVRPGPGENDGNRALLRYLVGVVGDGLVDYGEQHRLEGGVKLLLDGPLQAHAVIALVVLTDQLQKRTRCRNTRFSPGSLHYYHKGDSVQNLEVGPIIALR